MGTFDSKELRADLRGEYRFDFGTAFVAPLAEAQIRRYDFDGFSEEGAGALGLVVEDAEKTVFTPSLGVKFGTAFTTDLAAIRPEASLAYSFRGDNDAFRDVAYAGLLRRASACRVSIRTGSSRASWVGSPTSARTRARSYAARTRPAAAPKTPG